MFNTIMFIHMLVYTPLLNVYFTCLFICMAISMFVCLVAKLNLYCFVLYYLVFAKPSVTLPILVEEYQIMVNRPFNICLVIFRFNLDGFIHKCTLCVIKLLM